MADESFGLYFNQTKLLARLEEVEFNEMEENQEEKEN